MNRRNLAVFIDFENFGDRSRGGSNRFDAQKLINLLKEKGRLVVKKAYADWGGYGRDKHQMMENSVELIELPSHGKKGKNSADIKLVVDALETAITKEYIGTFVVVSGDSDYTPLIAKLREYDKYVIVIGIRKNVSSLLSGYCDELIYYDSLSDTSNKPNSNSDASDPLLRRVLSYLESEGLESRSSIVKQYMKQFDATFNEQHHGFRQFKEYLKDAERRRIIELRSSEHGEYFVTLINIDHSLTVLEMNSPYDESKYTLYSSIFYALQLIESIPDLVSRSSVLAEMLRRLEPDFSLSKYGYSKSQGFKKILQDMEAKSLLSRHLDNSLNDYLISKTEKLDQLVSQSEAPSNYRKTWLQSLLSTRSLLVFPDAYEHIVTLLSGLLQLEPNGIPLPHFIAHLEGDESTSTISTTNIKRALNMLIACKSVATITTIEEEAEHQIITAVDPLSIALLKMLNHVVDEVITITSMPVSIEEIAQVIGVDSASLTE